MCDAVRHLCRSIVLLTIVLQALASAPNAVADTTVETDITVTTQDAGAFSIGFAEVTGGYTFVNSENGTTFTVSAFEGDTATATVQLTWTDSRTEGNRGVYSIALGADDLTSSVSRPDGQGVYTIPAANLAIVEIAEQPPAMASTLDTTRTVYQSGSTPAAGTISLTIIVQLEIPPSSYPTTYTTIFHVQMVPGDQGP